MIKCGVLFEVRTEFLNIIYTSFDCKGLMTTSCQLRTCTEKIVNKAAATPVPN